MTEKPVEKQEFWNTNLISKLMEQNKYYLATIEIDLQALTKAYLDNTEQTEADTVENMLEHEFGWLEDLGIKLIELASIPEAE